MKKAVWIVLILLILSAAGFVVVNYYGYLFAKEVSGEITGVERVTEATAIVGSTGLPPNQLYSYAIAIKDHKSGEIVIASSEDRQRNGTHRGRYSSEGASSRHTNWASSLTDPTTPNGRGFSCCPVQVTPAARSTSPRPTTAGD